MSDAVWEVMIDKIGNRAFTDRAGGAPTAVTFGAAGVGDRRTAASFDGITSLANIHTQSTEDVFSGSEGTIVAWAKVSGAGVWADGTVRRIFQFRADSSNQILFGRTATNDRLIAQYTAGGTSEFVALDGLSDVDYMPLAISWSATNDQVKAYKDGAQAGSTQAGLGTFAGALNNATTLIGALNSAPANVWDGSIAHVAIWRTALTGAQITAIHNASDPAAQIFATEKDDLIGYWPLDDPAGSAEARDLSLYATQDTTDDVISMDGSLGFKTPNKSIARPSQLMLTLNNSASNNVGVAGYYSPEHASGASGITTAKGIRVRSTFDATTRTHGFWDIESIRPRPGPKGKRTTKVVCKGFMAAATRAPVNIATQLDQRADQLIDTLITSSSVFPPGVGGLWLLDKPGASELGVSTFLAALPDYLAADTGISTFPFAFDNSKQDASLYAMLREVVESERGRLFVNREGKVEFWSRHHLALDAPNAVDGTFAGTMFSFDYRFGDSVTNSVTVKHNPREIDTTGTPTLATLDKSAKIGQGETRTLTLRYDDGSGNRISTTDAIDPVANTDFTANTEEGGGGSDVTANFSIVADHFAQKSTWTVTNVSPSTEGFLQAGSKQRGNNKLTDFGKAEALSEDATSLSTFGRRAKVINARLLEDPDEALDTAAFEVASFKDPRGEAKKVSIQPRRNDALMVEGLARTIGDRITITETQTGATKDSFIIGEQFKVRDGGKSFDVSWILEPQAAQATWILDEPGFSELGITTTLGY